MVIKEKLIGKWREKLVTYPGFWETHMEKHLVHFPQRDNQVADKDSFYNCLDLYLDSF